MRKELPLWKCSNPLLVYLDLRLSEEFVQRPEIHQGQVLLQPAEQIRHYPTAEMYPLPLLDLQKLYLCPQGRAAATVPTFIPTSPDQIYPLRHTNKTERITRHHVSLVPRNQIISSCHPPLCQVKLHLHRNYVKVPGRLFLELKKRSHSRVTMDQPHLLLAPGRPHP